MRVPINLATEPFRRDRHIIVGFAAMCAALLLTLAVLTSMAVSARSRASHMRGEVERLNEQARALAAEQARYDTTLLQPGNAEVLERSLLLNTLLERKAVSWTRIFADLEKVMPATVRLMQIRLPRAKGPSEVTLDMLVGAQTPEPMLDFLRRLESSPLFGPAAISVAQAPTQNEPLYRYRVTVNYAQKP